VKPSDTLELLGVSFHRKFTVCSYVTKLAKEARFQASRVAHMRVEDVLSRLDYLLANQLAVKAAAMTIWGPLSARTDMAERGTRSAR
jgi:hypothetical protein